MKQIPRRRVLTGLAALPLTGLVGCGAPPAVTKRDGRVVVKVGQLPVVDAVAFTFAVDKGYFRRAGVEARADYTTPGAMVTSLVNGSDQFVLGETALLVSAYSKGLPVRVIGGITKSSERPADDSGGLLVMKDGPVRAPVDLNGRTIAVGALKGGGELALRAALDKAGADSKDVQVIEMPLSDMTAALTQRRIDAMSTISPFDTEALHRGATRLMAPGAEAAPGGMQMAVGTNAVFQSRYPEAVEGFLDGLRQGTEYAAAHPDEVRAALPKISQMPEDLVATMKLPVFDASGPRAALTIWTRLMERYAFVSKPIDVDSLMGG